MIFQSLKKTPLPNLDLDNLFCWENIEHCLLTLNADIWEDFYNDYMNSIGKRVAYKTGSKEIDEMEEMFASGDNVADKLETFFMKYNDEHADD